MISSPKNQHCLGAVSFFNTLPLIDGLERVNDLRILQDVPSRLINHLMSGETDISLCSVIDHQTSPQEIELVPVGLIGCDGVTDTVGLFSRCPIKEITQVACDTDSHTSVVLLQVILAQYFGIQPAIVPFNASEHNPIPDSVLLIGDKVIHQAPSVETHPHRIDLGEAWKMLTGLPFVFGAWFQRSGDDDRREHANRIAILLDHCRRHNRERIDSIIAREAPLRGWNQEHARRYLCEYLRFSPTPERIEAIREFHRRALDIGAISELRELRIAEVG